MTHYYPTPGATPWSDRDRLAAGVQPGEGTLGLSYRAAARYAVLSAVAEQRASRRSTRKLAIRLARRRSSAAVAKTARA